jgi:uncharacterized membrane protein YhhN
MGVTAIIMYLIVIIALLLPNLGDLTIPVFIYALVLSTMLLFVKFDVEETGNWYILIGAVLFVSSDSLVAFNKFYNPLVLSSFIIMILSNRAVFDCIRYFKIKQKNSIL